MATPFLKKVLFCFVLKYVYLCGYMNVIPSDHRGQKRALDLMELEVVSHPTWVPGSEL